MQHPLEIHNPLLATVIFLITIYLNVFITYAKFSEKLTILAAMIRTCACAYQGVRSVSESFLSVYKWMMSFLISKFINNS